MTDAGNRVIWGATQLRVGVKALDRVSDDFNSLTVDEAVGALTVVKEQLAILRQLDAALERWVAECFKAEGWFDPVEFPGLGTVEVRRAKNRRAWDHQMIRTDWLNRYLQSRDGEIGDPFEFIEDFLKVASVGSWKVTGLRAFEMDADDYCDSQPGTPTVSIVRASKDDDGAVAPGEASPPALPVETPTAAPSSAPKAGAA